MLTASNAHAAAPLTASQKLRAFLHLCKPRVNALIVFTALIGMFLAAPGLPPLARVFVATLGIGLVAFAAAALNCLVEQTIDARMTRTRWRATARGELSGTEVITAATVLGGAGLWLLHHFINDLTMWLTLATFVGYAVIYTLLLKPATPMNIVIGGASGAMPPLLGWVAMTGQVAEAPLVLFLIIFLWTPPHFWALACYRREDYAKSGLPMLPVTHGVVFTCQHILWYTLLLAGASLIPVSLGMSGMLYFGVVAVLNLVYLGYGIAMVRNYSDQLARRSFRFSIVYLTALFAALFADRLIPL
jgi:protoheme IX farnesyltransferase